MTRKLKVLLYGDVDLNIMDGSAVWLTSIANTLNYDSNINVDMLLKARVRNKQLFSEVDNLEHVNIIDTFNQFTDINFKNGNRMNVKEAVDLINRLHNTKEYDCIIVRGFDIVKELLHIPNIVAVTIPYITNFTHDLSKISKEEIELLIQIYRSFPQMFVQTPQMGDLFKEITNVNGDKLNLLFPMIPDYTEEKPDFKNVNNSIVYTGKFAEDWYTEEILTAFEKLNNIDSTITLNIAGDKFQGNLIRKRDIISARMNEAQNINWVGSVSRSNSMELVKQSDIGIAWRSLNIDNSDSVELSTKLLEYGRLGKPVLLRRTQMHEELLGQDYPLFIDHEDEFVNKSLEILNNRKLYRKAAKRIYNSCEKYTFYEAYKRLRPLLWSFNKEKVKLVFAGHDLKFIKMAIDYFEEHPAYEVKIDQWKGHTGHDIEASKKYLEWADIIFCEWGLGNAVWYSNNKKKGQKLIVRMHLQERVTEHPSNFQMDNIDRVIAISPFIYEEFNRVSKIPREKMTMIYNMIDTEKYNKTKYTNQNIMFNIGICGILPSRKRLDRALNVFEALWKRDKRYKLYIKSKLPQEVPWLMNREEEKVYYNQVFERINNSPWGDNVIFDKHGNDMDEWFRKIGFVLSTSDYESFHLAPMEGMASGSIPVVLNWPGAETIYTKEYIFETEESIVEFISSNQNVPKVKKEKLIKCTKEFDKKVIIRNIENLIRDI
ncbi:glycosyltransferase [Oceanobacillus kapialis]|uniref:Glycosyltransferase n=1 Tax=Oceanobacillus kapialis TaxID=481353 RepID=A0ABW5PWZ4_9BACI